MARTTSTERMRLLRRRRRRGRMVARIELDPVEIKKLTALGYLAPGTALDLAAEAYLSDKLAEESLKPLEIR